MNVTPEPTLTGYKFTPDAVAALTELGFTDLPDGVVITHREATNREKNLFNTRIQEFLKPGALDDEAAQEFLTDLLMRRVTVETPREYVRELVRDMGETDMAGHLIAFIQGVMPDPKALAQAIMAIRTGPTNRLLSGVQSGMKLSSVTSTPA